jgi:2-C-methyl-D-erythritol 4-phosphate cytidylyltransferase
MKDEKEVNFSDDCTLFMKHFPSEKVFLVDGDDNNIKITHFSDLIHAESILRMDDFVDLSREISIQNGNTTHSAVVFGGSSGIGKSLYLELLEIGVPTRVASRSLSQTDVCNPEDVRSFLEDASQSIGPISLVFNCAGEIADGGISEMDYPDMERTLRTNVIGAATVIRESLPFLAGRNGCITLVSSSAATHGRGDQVLYSASKSAVESITQSFADQISDSGIRVNAIRPARTATRKRSTIFGDEEPHKLLCPRFVAKAMLRVSLLGSTGKIYPLSVLEQGDYASSCHECQNYLHD